jgi:hypothetical protein
LKQRFSRFAGRGPRPSVLPTSPEAEVTEDSEEPEATDMASLPVDVYGKHPKNDGKYSFLMEKQWKITIVNGKTMENHHF